jgi:carbon-monoxide dehydrogenase medium subunit
VDYERPQSLAEALELLRENGEDARPLAGGQSLIPMLRLRISTPRLLVDLAGIPGLDPVDEQEEAVRIGALVRHERISACPELADLDVFADAGHGLGDVQVRSRGTFVGALAHADPSADWAAVAIATNTMLHIAGPQGTRQVAADNFFMYAFTTDLQPGELVTHAAIPRQPARRVSSYVKLANEASGYALAGVAVVANVDGDTVISARIGATGVAITPRRLPAAEAALTGTSLRTGQAAIAAEAAPEGVEPISDTNASGDYRLHLLRVACRRAIETISRRLDRSGQEA